MKGHSPSQYLQGFFTFPAFRNSFWGNLPPMVRLELPSGWLLPVWCGWSSLHSHLGQLSGWWQLWWPPTSPSLSASLTHCTSSSWVGACSTSGAGGPLALGVPVPSPAPLPSFILIGLFYHPPFVASSLFWLGWKLDTGRVNQSETRAIFQEPHGTHLNF